METVSRGSLRRKEVGSSAKADAELVDLGDIRRRLARLDEQERTKDVELRELLGRHGDVEVKMASLQRLVPRLGTVLTDAASLSEMVGTTCALADDVSTKVRELDTVKVRLQQTLQRAKDISGLRACVDGVRVALKSEDFEGAARHVSVYLTFDDEMLQSEAAGAMAEGDNPVNLMRTAHEDLTAVLHAKFDEAAETGDMKAAKRFFKLFPLVNQHSEGLDKFGRFAAAELAKQAESRLKRRVAGAGEKVAYVDLVARLVEAVATAIKEVQAVVNEHYGPGHVLRVLKQLQDQCDAQAAQLLDQFASERELESRIHADLADTNPAEFDTLLGELAEIMKRCALYLNLFLHKLVTGEIGVVKELKAKAEAGEPLRVELPNEAALGHALLNGDMAQRMQSLTGLYVNLEERGLQRNISTAMQLNTMENEDSKTTTVVDDAFFVIAKSARRAMSTWSTNCFCAMLNQICAILETKFLSMFKKQVQAQLNAGGIADILGNIKIPSGKRAESGPSDGSDNLIITLNNLETSRKFAMKLFTDLGAESKRLYKHSSASDHEKIASCLGGLRMSATQLEALVKDAIEQLCASTLAVRLKPMAESMQTHSFELTEDDLAVHDTGSAFVTNYIELINKVLEEYKAALLEPNYELLVANLTGHVASQLERVIFKCTFNRLGGVQLERDLRCLTTYLSSLTQWPCRDKFARTSQLALLLTLESVEEVSEYYAAGALGSTAYRVSSQQVAELLGRRSDISKRDLSQLSL